MMRAMFAGVSGLKNHQLKMDVIGNNIANVNTYGFKASRVTFQDIFSQTLRGGTAPSENGRGGTNPLQVGLGMAVASIDTFHTQGNLQPTGKGTDLAIQGDGFFVLTDGSKHYYSRAGIFDFDRDGNLVNPSGLKVVDINGNPVRIPPDKLQTSPARTTRVEFVNNLDPSTASYLVSQTVYDNLGQKYTLQFTFTNQTPATPNQWQVEVDVTDPDGNPVATTFAPITLTFDPANGKIQSGNPSTATLTNPLNLNPASDITVDFSNITQYAGIGTTVVPDADGHVAGDLTTFSIQSDGKIVGTYSNGEIDPNLGIVALASFENPGGLMKTGDSTYIETFTSGPARIRQPGMKGVGTIAAGSLEMSNVDLALEFTEMIITQRGFQANSKIISTSDEILQDLVNMKR